MQPALEDSRPAFVVSTCSKLRDIVSGCVGLDAGDFAKIVDRVLTVAGAAADTCYKQPAAGCASTRQQGQQPIDGLVSIFLTTSDTSSRNCWVKVIRIKSTDLIG